MYHSENLTTTNQFIRILLKLDKENVILKLNDKLSKKKRI